MQSSESTACTIRGVDEDGGSGAFIHPLCGGLAGWNGASLRRGALSDSSVGAMWWQSDLALGSRHVAAGSDASMPVPSSPTPPLATR
jgi:hypothetical protein